jgi:hypothetical protein
MNLADRLRDETVFILGAGASVPYGFPTGGELVGNIIGGRFPPDSVVARHPQFNDFRANLAGAKARSVDIFLSRDKQREFESIGKLAIAENLLFCEAHEKIFGPDIKDDWYEYVFNTVLERTTDLAEVAELPLAFITFNFDRSLEHFLYVYLKSNFPNNVDAEVIEVIGRIKIVHVHGYLGPLDWQQTGGRSYGDKVTADSVMKAAQNIHIMHETIADSEDFKYARAIIELADSIMLLGFGYHAENMERLALPFKRLGGQSASSGVTQIRQIWGTAYGMTHVEAEHTRVAFNNEWKFGDVNWKCREALRHNHVFLATFLARKY